MDNDRPTLPKDFRKAEVAYDKKFGKGAFKALPTRKRNRLAREKRFDREYHELCAAIEKAGDWLRRQK